MLQTDKLDIMLELRESFMRKLRDSVPGTYPEWPIDPHEKSSQLVIRDITLRGVEEMFEAVQHLKNSKPHRQTEIHDFNREEFVEEFVDALNYFFSVLVLLGVDSEELFESYKKKHAIILERIRKKY